MKTYIVTFTNGKTQKIKGFYIDEACRNSALTKEDLKGAIITQISR